MSKEKTEKSGHSKISFLKKIGSIEMAAIFIALISGVSLFAYFSLKAPLLILAPIGGSILFFGLIAWCVARSLSHRDTKRAPLSKVTNSISTPDQRGSFIDNLPKEDVSALEQKKDKMRQESNEMCKQVRAILEAKGRSRPKDLIDLEESFTAAQAGFMSAMIKLGNYQEEHDGKGEKVERASESRLLLSKCEEELKKIRKAFEDIQEYAQAKPAPAASTSAEGGVGVMSESPSLT